MKGKFYGIGVGPGDPELMTLKAVKTLERCACIAVPKTMEEKESLALSIARQVITEEKEILDLVFPMTHNKEKLDQSWAAAAEKITGCLDQGKNVALITLGDPSVYSTCMYVLKKLQEMEYEVEMIPGITSFCASAARAGISLAENRETLAVIPSAYDFTALDQVLDTFDNVVMMKVSAKLQQVKEKLYEKGLDKQVVTVSRCGLEGEKIHYGLDGMEEESVSYFTTMIVKKNGRIQ